MTTTQTPPHDLDAEAVILSALMFKPELVPEVARILHDRDFYSDANRWIHEAVMELDERGDPVDPVSVLGWLRDHELAERVGGAPYLAQLADATPAMGNVLDHARRVARLAKVRAVQDLARVVAAEGYGPDAASDEWLTSIEARFYELGRHTVARETIETAKELAHGESQRLTTKDEPLRLIRTGISKLDRLMGGLGRGNQYVVAGRPGHGKTAFVLQVSQNVASEGHGVHFCSVEMPRPQLVIRAISQQCLIDNKRIARRQIQGNEWDDVFAACQKFGKLPLTVDDRPAPTVAEIRNSIRRGITKQRRDHGSDTQLGLVVVDYLQLCKAPGLPREQEVSAISAGLLEIAKEFDCAVIALSQLNRSIESRPDKTPKLSDLRESGAIEQDAFGVIFVYREDCYESDEQKRNGMADIIVAKLRQGGETGKVTVRYNAPATWFYVEQSELEKEIDNTQDTFVADNDPPPDRRYVDRGQDFKRQAAGDGMRFDNEQ